MPKQRCFPGLVGTPTSQIPNGETIAYRELLSPVCSCGLPFATIFFSLKEMVVFPMTLTQSGRGLWHRVDGLQDGYSNLFSFI